jgi:hypothetical protein
MVSACEKERSCEPRLARVRERWVMAGLGVRQCLCEKKKRKRILTFEEAGSLELEVCGAV